MKQVKLYLCTLFVLAVLLRVYLAYFAGGPSYDAYFTLRQVEHILAHGTPLIEDPLGFGGRTLRFSPLFYYVLAPFRLFLDPTWFVLIIPNLLAGTIVLAMYRLSLRISGSPYTALFVALLAGLNSIFLMESNAASLVSAALPLFIFSLDMVLGLAAGENLGRCMFILILLTLLSPISLVVAAALLIYLLLLRIEGLRPDAREIEVAMFYGLFTAWFHAVLYKAAMHSDGINALWLSIPRALAQERFISLDVLELIAALGVFTVIFGLLGLYGAVTHRRSRNTLLVFAAMLVILALLWARIVAFEYGVMLLGFLLSIFAGEWLRHLQLYALQTKVARAAKLIVLTIALVMVLGGSISAINASTIIAQRTPPSVDIQTLQVWAPQSQPQAKILGEVDEGHMLAYYTGAMTAMDTWFFGVEHGRRTFAELVAIKETPFTVQAVRTMSQYSITHVFVSSRAAAPPYLTSTCFTVVQEGPAQIYERECAPQ